MEEVYKWCNIVDHHKLFSTHLFVFDNFLDGVQHKADVEDMKCYIPDEPIILEVEIVKQNR